jgi:pectate lyase-like protein
VLRRRRVALLVAGTIVGAALVALAGPAAAVEVSTEAELKAAFATESQIDVQADIVLTDCTDGGAVERMAAVTDPVTVDGHGHTIRQTCTDNVFLQSGPGLLTIHDLTITAGTRPGTAERSSPRVISP